LQTTESALTVSTLSFGSNTIIATVQRLDIEEAKIWEVEALSQLNACSWTCEQQAHQRNEEQRTVSLHFASIDLLHNLSEGSMLGLVAVCCLLLVGHHCAMAIELGECYAHPDLDEVFNIKSQGDCPKMVGWKHVCLWVYTGEVRCDCEDLVECVRFVVAAATVTASRWSGARLFLRFGMPGKEGGHNLIFPSLCAGSHTGLACTDCRAGTRMMLAHFSPPLVSST
jgi:hypothetical protein